MTQTFYVKKSKEPIVTEYIRECQERKIIYSDEIVAFIEQRNKEFKLKTLKNK